MKYFLGVWQLFTFTHNSVWGKRCNSKPKLELFELHVTGATRAIIISTFQNERHHVPASNVTLPKTNSSPLRIGNPVPPKKTMVFQPSIFRCCGTNFYHQATATSTAGATVRIQGKSAPKDNQAPKGIPGDWSAWWVESIQVVDWSVQLRHGFTFGKCFNFESKDCKWRLQMIEESTFLLCSTSKDSRKVIKYFEKWFVGVSLTKIAKFVGFHESYGSHFFLIWSYGQSKLPVTSILQYATKQSGWKLISLPKSLVVG